MLSKELDELSNFTTKIKEAKLFSDCKRVGASMRYGKWHTSFFKKRQRYA